MHDSLRAGERVPLERVGIFADGVAVRRVGDIGKPEASSAEIFRSFMWRRASPVTQFAASFGETAGAAFSVCSK